MAMAARTQREMTEQSLAIIEAFRHEVDGRPFEESKLEFAKAGLISGKRSMLLRNKVCARVVHLCVLPRVTHVRDATAEGFDLAVL